MGHYCIDHLAIGVLEHMTYGKCTVTYYNVASYGVSKCGYCNNDAKFMTVTDRVEIPLVINA